MTKTTIDKMKEIGIIEYTNNAVRLSPKWQKLIFDELKEFDWKASHKHSILFDMFSTLIENKHPTLDAFTKIEISYYIFEMVAYILKTRQDGKTK